MDELTLALPGGLTITGMHAGNIELLGMILRQL
jgi:lauroyl/myristoyl acyltransferase